MKYKDYRGDTSWGRILKEELLIIQNNKCLICKKEFKNSRNIHLDHEHDTDEIRGLLCQICNVAMAAFDANDNIILEFENYKKNCGIKNILIELEPKIKLIKDKIKIESSKKHSANLKKYYSNPENRERSSRLTKEYFSIPENLENRRKKKDVYYSNPENRENARKKSKESWDKRKELNKEKKSG